MAVRIVFRGLMLFHFPDTGPNAGRLVAWLIDPAAAAARPEPRARAARNPRDHSAEIQVVHGAARRELIHTALRPGDNVDIAITGGQPIARGQSFGDHVANLERIIQRGTPAVQGAARGNPNRQLVRNVVTVDRGLVRVKDVMAWDEGAFPLGGGSGTGNQPSSPVRLNFVGSEFQGHMASEVIVEVDDAVRVQLMSGNGALNGPRNGSAQPRHRHVPPNTVEILVINYEPPAVRPTPWGLDFQWLFDAVGYTPASLVGARFNAWIALGTQYDPGLLATERADMLGGPQNDVGWPFPYIDPARPLTALTPLASPRNPPVCPFAFTDLSVDESTAIGQTLAAESGAASVKMATKAPAKPAAKPETVGRKTVKATRPGKAPAKKAKAPAKKKAKQAKRAKKR